MLAPGLPFYPGALQARSRTALVVGSADPPYRIFARSGATGLYYDLLNEAASRLAWPLRYEETPSARALRMMELGEADLMVGPFRSPERERFLIYTQAPLPPVAIAFYTRPFAPVIKAPDDLLGLRIAVHRGKRYGPEFDGDARLSRHALNNYRTAFEMVVRGRLDVVVIPELQGDLLQQELQLELVKQPLRMAAQQAHVVLSRRSPWQNRQGDLERAFRAMREDGSWQAILQRYR